MTARLFANPRRPREPHSIGSRGSIEHGHNLNLLVQNLQCSAMRVPGRVIRQTYLRQGVVPTEIINLVCDSSTLRNERGQELNSSLIEVEHKFLQLSTGAGNSSCAVQDQSNDALIPEVPCNARIGGKRLDIVEQRFGLSSCDMDRNCPPSSGYSNRRSLAQKPKSERHYHCGQRANRRPSIPVDFARWPKRPAANERPFQRVHVSAFSEDAILP